MWLTIPFLHQIFPQWSEQSLLQRLPVWKCPEEVPGSHKCYLQRRVLLHWYAVVAVLLGLTAEHWRFNTCLLVLCALLTSGRANLRVQLSTMRYAWVYGNKCNLHMAQVWFTSTWLLSQATCNSNFHLDMRHWQSCLLTEVWVTLPGCPSHCMFSVPSLSLPTRSEYPEPAIKHPPATLLGTSWTRCTPLSWLPAKTPKVTAVWLHKGAAGNHSHNECLSFHPCHPPLQRSVLTQNGAY